MQRGKIKKKGGDARGKEGTMREEMALVGMRRKFTWKKVSE